MHQWKSLITARLLLFVTVSSAAAQMFDWQLSHAQIRHLPPDYTLFISYLNSLYALLRLYMCGKKTNRRGDYVYCWTYRCYRCACERLSVQQVVYMFVYLHVWVINGAFWSLSFSLRRIWTQCERRGVLFGVPCGARCANCCLFNSSANYDLTDTKNKPQTDTECAQSSACGRTWESNTFMCLEVDRCWFTCLWCDGVRALTPQENVSHRWCCEFCCLGELMGRNE